MTTMLEKRSVLSLLVLGVCVATLPRISAAREFKTPPLTVDEVIAVGRAAPSLRLAEVLQAPEGFDPSWEALKGRVVVLEFWATWCAPCIPALDHLGELQAKHSDVLVLGISPEDPGRMARFLERRQVSFPVALDKQRTTFDAYGIRGVPTTHPSGFPRSLQPILVDRAPWFSISGSDARTSCARTGSLIMVDLFCPRIQGRNILPLGRDSGRMVRAVCVPGC